MSSLANEWQVAPLGQLSDIAIGGTPSRDIGRYWASDGEEGEPWVSIADMTQRVLFETKERITSAGIANSNVKRVAAQTVLMSFKLSLGKVAVAGTDLYTNEAIAAFRPGQALDSRFLYYALPDAVSRTATDVAIKGATLNKASLAAIPLRHPALPIQQRIAAIITNVDNAIESTEALIEKHQQIKAGLMHDLFTRGVLASGELRPTRAAAPELYREQSGSWFPEGWQFERLDDLALRGSGHTPNKDVAEYWNGGIKWVSLADSYRLDTLYISDTESTISHRGIQNSSAVLHPAGIVVLSRDAGVGKSAITTEPMAVSQHFMCWKCDQRLDNHFLYYWLQFQKRTFENIAMGSTILTIGLPYFKKLRIACPVDLEEQRRIAIRLKAADENLFALQRRLSKLRTQKLGLMQDLLTGKVPVKVPEPAIPA